MPVTEIQELGTSEPHRIIAKANHPTYWKSDSCMELKLGYIVEGDVQLRISHYTQSLMAFVKSMNRLHNIFVATQTATSTYAYPLVPLFRFSFHTSFIAERGEVKLNLENLDNIFAGPLKSKKCTFFSEISGISCDCEKMKRNSVFLILWLAFRYSFKFDCYDRV